LTATARASVQHFALQTTDAGILGPVLARCLGCQKGYQTVSSSHSPLLPHYVASAMAMAGWVSDPVVDEVRLAQLKLVLSTLNVRGVIKGAASARIIALENAVKSAGTRLNKSSIEALAREAGYSPSHFRSLFAEHYGIQPGQYIRRLRINEAKQMLRETRRPIKEIAVELGYADTVSFHRSFTSATGHTPASYRHHY